MIKSKNGVFKAEGTISDVLADLCVAVASLNEELTKDLGAEEAKKAIMESVEFAFKSEEEIKAENEKLEAMFHEALGEFIDKLMKGLGK